MDLFTYLEQRGIEYTIGPSRNVKRGFIGIQCPYPSCGDSSNHCGIGPNLKHHCLRCGRSGDMITLIRMIENCSFKRAKEVFNTIKGSTGAEIVSPPQSMRTRSGAALDSVEFPKEMEKFGKEHKKYLLKRGFNAKYLIKEYLLSSTDHLGWLGELDYRFRIIIPIWYKWRIVSFTSRDITGKSELRYFHCPVDKSIIAPKHCLYNIDSVKKGEAAIIVEGVTDVWRIGSGAVAIFGITMIDEQVEMLIEKKLKKAYVLLDANALSEARKLQKNLRAIIPYVKVISLDIGDPASNLTRRNIKFLRDLLR